MHAIIMAAHGSRLESANQDVRQVAQDLRKIEINCYVLAAYLELAEPSIPQAIEQAVSAGANPIMIVPYFLLLGSHVLEDLPSIVQEARRRYPEIDFRLAGYIGFHPLLATIIEDQYNELRKKTNW